MNNIIKINDILLEKSESGSYFTTIPAEKYDVGKNHFAAKYRSIFVSGEMYPGTDKNFIYITSDLHGTYRGYRCRKSYDIGIANIFASGKTLDEAIEKFAYNLKNYIYNKS